MSELCIVLTAEQAQRDWSGSRKGTALRPVLLADGETYVLPALVLEQAAHTMHYDFLKELPQRVVEDEEFVTIADSDRKWVADEAARVQAVNEKGSSFAPTD